MLRCVTVAVLLLASTTYAGLFDDISDKASEVGDFFTNQFNNVKDLFAGDQAQLERNVDRVKGLLRKIQEKAKTLEAKANQQQKETLSHINEYLNEVSQFGDQVARDGKEKFQENSAKWQEMLDSLFQKGGLDDVLKMSMRNSANQYTALSAAVVTIILAFIC